jgi:hypothetical protein
MFQINQSPPLRNAAPAEWTPWPQELLIGRIRAHIRKGDAAKERATQNQKKSEEHYIAAGKYLTELKANYAPSWQAWEDLLRVKVGLSTGRASELMQIADGRKSVQEIRDTTAQRVKALRATRDAFVTDRRNEGKAKPAPIAGTAPSKRMRELTRKLVRDWTENEEEKQRPAGGTENCLVHPGPVLLAFSTLIDSTPESRRTAVATIVRGACPHKFEQLRDAVADIYQQLAKAGR